ncbi:cytochrome P450 [Pseudonocardia nematodicida]|uniref:Cytochrome P450 n=1 Tax=Pseudonocardia nematodicida TaxID=1206997 RepID=A0ABV1KB74_9PSEU
MLTRLRDAELRTPSDGPVATLFRGGMPDGELRDVEYLLPSQLLVFLGGLQEPGHACGVTFHGLSTRPEQMARVKDDPSLLGRAVVEGLRWMSPLYGGASRTAVTDTTLGGQQIRGGDHIWLIYGSANADEGEFDDPLTYDLDRARHPNLAFGLGRHACIGSAYAPQVARIALEELFRAAPGIRLDPQRPPDPVGWMFRGSRELHTVRG